MHAAATIWLWVLAAPVVQAAGFGPPEGTLPIHPLPVTVPAGALSPLWYASLFREEPSTGATPTYYLGAGVVGSRLPIPDSPGATAWQVVTTADCVRLEPVPTALLHTPAVQAVLVQKNPLPMECAAAFEGSCTSRDGKLRITTAFDGRRRAARVGGGFFGTEGTIDTTFYTGVRTLSIEHLPSRLVLRMQERLNNANGYSAPQTAIRYLPELQRLLLLGASEARGMPLTHCVALPPG
ncbi:hypothetical protein CLU85_2595 [Acidovorax sp. 69]|uniref:hypothetical protein n=1 Tax=Acidovorax sp. 69 TaxID=2035202 RepID=UPI000C23060A|nr:hypothetical protein [Acidovorax sp. 69]PJI97796.1 hypothetical protein CLU85_2595 [Acidovorax sp. 69]